MRTDSRFAKTTPGLQYAQMLLSNAEKVKTLFISIFFQKKKTTRLQEGLYLYELLCFHGHYICMVENLRSRTVSFTRKRPHTEHLSTQFLLLIRAAAQSIAVVERPPIPSDLIVPRTLPADGRFAVPVRFCISFFKYYSLFI